MSILSLIVSFLGGWRATCFAALCVALSATVWVQSHRLGTARDQIASDAKTISTFESAQETNMAAIASLKSANTAWSQKCSVDPAATVKASEDTVRDASALPDDDARRSDDRRKLYDTDKSAAEWGREPVPDAAARRLRQ